MPKKNAPATPEDQSRKFVEEVQKLIDAGELNPTDAEAVMERAMTKVRTGESGVRNK